MKNINPNIIVLSYYHPWIAGGGHRPHQLLLEDLKRNKKVAFLFCSNAEYKNISNFITEKIYSNLDLYYLDEGTIISLNSNQKFTNLEELTKYYNPKYVRAHNPVNKFLDYLTYLNKQKICFVYDQMDDWKCFSVQPWGGIETEREYVKKANLITTITHKLASELEHEKVMVIPNAIRNDFLKPFESSLSSYKSLPSNFTKHIIYTGAMWPDWFDWKLCAYLVNKFPNYKFTFVGATTSTPDEDNGSETQSLTNQLKSFPNVEFIEEIPHHLLPSLLLSADVGIIPFKVNDLTLGCSPLKTFDYLAGGLPVVSSALIQMKDYPFFYYGLDYPEIANQLLKADKRQLSLQDKDKMKNFITKNTWEDRINELDRFLENNNIMSGF